jgi:ethanolamine kinase
MQLLKVVKKRPGMSEEELDRQAVLMRAYGKGTSIIIDRESEYDWSLIRYITRY